MTSIAQIKDVIFMKILPPIIALIVMIGMLAGIMFLSILPYMPK